MKEQFRIDDNKLHKCVMHNENENICKCEISVDNNIWTISSWYTNPKYLHKGFGKKTMKKLLDHLYDTYGEPNRIQYIWNGSNSYVFDWLENNFGAVSKCPIAIQKYASDDDWESHIYYLNKDKFIKYFKLGEL